VTSLLARASLRYLTRHPTQLLLAVLGVALGVAVVVGIDTASVSARRAFELSGRAVRGAATHLVRDVDEALYVKLASEPNAAPMAPLVQATAALPQFGGRALELLGVDGFAEARVRPSLAGLGGANALVAVARGAALESGLARELGLGLGDQFDVVVGSGRTALEVAALLEGENAAASAALADLLVVDIALAQDLTGSRGRLSRIDFVLPEADVEHVREQLPPNVRLEEADARQRSLASLTRAFEVNLRALSLLALLVGVFLVYNTMTFSVVQRRALWGALRTLGVTRGEIFRLVCVEALGVGALGAALGVGLGLLLAQELVKLVTRTINDLYFVVEVRALSVEPLVLAQAVAAGIGATLLAALAPARDAVRTPPRAALNRSGLESRMRADAPRYALLGVLCCAIACAVFAWSTAPLVASLGALFAMLIGCALLVPLLTLGACRALAPLAGALAGNLGRMATRGIATNLSRTGVAIASLAIALSATAGMGVMVESFRSTVARWLRSTLRADVYVSAPTLTSTRVATALAPKLVERLVGAPGVAGANLYRALELQRGDGEWVRAVAMQFDPRGRDALELLEGERAAAWRAFDTRDVVLISEPLARRSRLEVGDTFDLAAPAGVRNYEVAAIFRDYSTDAGFAFIPRRAYVEAWGDASISSLGLFAAPGVDAEQLVADLRAQLGADEQAFIRTRTTLENASLKVFDQTFEVTRVLRLIAGGVAFLGVLCALLALELEREREFGVLRALGLSPRGVRALVLLQTGLMGLIAGALALPIGMAVSLVLIQVINERAFGWSLALEAPPLVFLETLLLSIGAALLAGLAPAWRMARIQPARALRAD
jgi:putative ABC transport system permease protein